MNQVNQHGQLMLIEVSVHGYIPISKYSLTIPPPEITTDGFILSSNVFDKIKNIL